MTMGGRICVMKDGVIQQVDTPLNIYDNPANMFVAGFIGTPPMNFFRGELKLNDACLTFAGKTFALPIHTPEYREKLLAYTGQEMVFGIRPEDIDSEQAKNTPGAPRITAKVEVVEPMGSETFVYLDTGAETFIAKVDPHKPLEVGTEVTLPLDLEKAHIFTIDAGKTIV
jgi:multiple sugar transport system ATP-binding protein